MYKRQLLAIGGINLPIHHCCKTGEPIIPPLGNWEWSCYYLPSEGFSSMEDPQSILKINASEVALLQRLLFPELPIKSNGDLLGPKNVWLKILFIIETWISTQLDKDLSSLKMLREIYSYHFHEALKNLINMIMAPLPVNFINS